MTPNIPRGGRFLWTPDSSRRSSTRLLEFAEISPRWGAPVSVRSEGTLDYATLHQWSIDCPESFWAAVWEFCGVVASGSVEPAISPELKGQSVGSVSRAGGYWFPNVRLNFAENLLSGRPESEVLVGWDEKGRVQSLTREQLREEVARFASGLQDVGVAVGDCVAGYLPTVVESVVAFLGTASIGAIWTSCSPDFGTEAVLDRLGQTVPKVLVAAESYLYRGRSIDCLPKISEIVNALPSIEKLVLVGESSQSKVRSVDNTVSWEKFGTPGADPDFVRLPFDHPLVVLYSSGTTGLPKAIVHGAGGTLIQHLKEQVLHTDIGCSDRVFYYTTCGWMMWNWLVSSLAAEATVVLYSGAPHATTVGLDGSSRPDILWRLAEEESLSVFGTSAKYLALMENEGVSPRLSRDLSSLKTILSTGSPLSPQSFEYVYREVKEDVHLASISGGTDIVSCFVLGVPTEPVRSGEIQGTGLGMSVEVQAPEGGRRIGSPGELVCTAPFPSMPIKFWDDIDGERYQAAYFESILGVWRHGDWAEQSAEGGWIIHGRSDATLNPGGVRIGTAEIYRLVESFDEVVESVAVGREVILQGQEDTEIVLFVRLRDGLEISNELVASLRQQIRTGASPHHAPKQVVQVPDIPRTVSGKLSELAVREAIHGRTVPNLSALSNPESVVYFSSWIQGAA